MAENLMCKTQKASSQDFRDNFDRTFNHIHPKNCYAKLTVKKEDLPENVREHFYPEEIREREIERKLKNTDTPWMPKKEYLPGGMKDFLYPEEIRKREIERRLKMAENA